MGYLREDGYREISVGYETFLAHRLAWFYHYGTWPELSLDHTNENKDDNRIENLREATLEENNFNVSTYSHNTSGFKGVSSAKYGKFRASISINNRYVHLGTYETPEEAYKVYCDKVKEIRGEFGKI